MATSADPGTRPQWTIIRERHWFANGFDVLFGIVAPLACVLVNVALNYNRGVPDRGGIFGRYVFVVYIALALGLPPLLAAIALRRRLGNARGVIAGILLTGLMCVGLLSLPLLPLSVVMLTYSPGLSLLLLCPFLAAMVFLRQVKHTLIDDDEGTPGNRLFFGSMLAGALLISAVPIAAQMQADAFVGAHVQVVIRADEAAAQQSIHSLQSIAVWCPLDCYDDIVWAYAREHDAERRLTLQNRYQAITDYDIETRLRFLQSIL